MLQLPILIEVTNLKRLGKILAEIVGSAELQGLSIPHHRLERVGDLGARELLRVRLASRNYGDGRFLRSEIRINIPHLACLRFCLLGCSVRGMPLLPEKLECAQEELG